VRPAFVARAPGAALRRDTSHALPDWLCSRRPRPRVRGSLDRPVL